MRVKKGVGDIRRMRVDELTSSGGRRSSSSAGSPLIASRQSTPFSSPFARPAARTASLQIRSILSRSQNPITARFPLCMITLLNSLGASSLPCAIVCAWAEPPSVSSRMCGTTPPTPGRCYSSSLQDCSGNTQVSFGLGPLTAARRLPREGDVPRITAEPLDVSLDPFQRERLVVEPKVALLDTLVRGVLRP
jgi:hypothetical protein